MAGIPLSGTQHLLHAGDYDVVIAGVGASVRSLTHRGRDLVVPYQKDEVRPAYRGATLAPWPNRVVDGRYTLDGQTHVLALSEPDRGHALHGLATWLDYGVADEDASSVTMEAVIEAQSGYPWRVRVRTTFSLGTAGLTQSVTATNDGAGRAPWGTGPHPYLVAGPSALNDWTLELPAAEVLHVTPDRLIPTELRAVDPARFDFRAPRRLGDVELDHAYTAVQRDADGSATVRLTDAAAGSGVTMVWDASCPWVQVHTADLPGGPRRPGHRAGLAVEPMTCAPDAFNAATYPYDTGLIRLDPGESAVARWRIGAI